MTVFYIIKGRSKICVWRLQRILLLAVLEIDDELEFEPGSLYLVWAEGSPVQSVNHFKDHHRSTTWASTNNQKPCILSHPTARFATSEHVPLEQFPDHAPTFIQIRSLTANAHSGHDGKSHCLRDGRTVQSQSAWKSDPPYSAIKACRSPILAILRCSNLHIHAL